MKARWFACLLLPLLAAAVEKPEQKKPAQPAPRDSQSATQSAASKAAAKGSKRAAKAAQPGVPADAVEVEPGTWRWTDPQGKPWLLRQTPFGIMKGEITAPAETGDLPAGMVAFDAGDSVRFERPHAFGNRLSWTKKKTELNDVEQRVWDRERRKAEEAKAAASEGAPAENSASKEQK